MSGLGGCVQTVFRLTSPSLCGTNSNFIILIRTESLVTSHSGALPTLNLSRSLISQILKTPVETFKYKKTKLFAFFVGRLIDSGLPKMPIDWHFVSHLLSTVNTVYCFLILTAKSVNYENNCIAHNALYWHVWKWDTVQLPRNHVVYVVYFLFIVVFMFFALSEI